jgi:hypothetical protein
MSAGVNKTVRIRRPDRLVAVALLTALGACLALLAQPSSASAVDSYKIHASVRYGCAQHGEDSFVEVGLNAVEHDQDHDQDPGKDKDPDQDGRELVLQVGLAGPESTDSAVFPEGGPSLVTLGEKPIKVRLAGPAHDGDHVFIRQVDDSQVITLPLQAECHRIKPTNFGLDEPDVRVTAKSCTAGSQANLQVTLDNPNDVDKRLEKIGIEQIDYTVLLVRQDGLLAGTDPDGTLVSFDEPSASMITLRQVVTRPASYEVRVIALDGSVVTSDSLRLSCASTGRPGPSSTSRPTPSVPVTPSPSTTQSSSTPAQTSTPTVTQRPTPPATSSSAPTSSVPASSVPASSVPASSVPASSAPASSVPPVTSQPPVSSAPAGGLPGPTARGTSSPAPRPSSSVAQPSNSTPASSPPASSATAGATPSSSSSSTDHIIQVEPRANYGAVPVFQKDVALVVLVFSAALTALVGATVVNARRR